MIISYAFHIHIFRKSHLLSNFGLWNNVYNIKGEYDEWRIYECNEWNLNIEWKRKEIEKL